MKRVKLFIVASVGLAVCGCGESVHPMVREQIRLHGYVGRDKTSNLPDGRVRLAKVLVDGQKESKPLPRSTRIMSQEYMLLQYLTGDLHKYGILAGPHHGSPTEAAHLLIESGKNPSGISVPVVQVECGWVYLTGTGPQVQTTWVTAGASGSRIVMEITFDETARPVHRFYFLQGLSGWVESRLVSGTRQTFTSADVNKYVDAYADGTLSGLNTVGPVGTPARDFLDSIGAYITESAIEAME